MALASYRSLAPSYMEPLGPYSDIDLLVEFHPDRIPSFFEVARMEREISEMLEAAHDLENFVFDESTGVLHSLRFTDRKVFVLEARFC